MLFAEIACTEERHKIERLYISHRFYMLNEAMFYLNNKHSAEDAVHESFLRIARNLHKIDEEDTARTRNFLIIICRNVAKDILKKQLPLVTVPEMEEPLMATGSIRQEQNPEISVIYDEEVEEAVELVMSLDKIYSDAFLLNKAYGFTCEEIAEIFGISRETAKKRVTRAGEKIKSKLYGKERKPGE